MKPHLLGRQRTTLARLADTLLEDHPGWTPEDSFRVADRLQEVLPEWTVSSRWIFRLALLAFEWGGLWLKTMDNRFEHFVLMSPAARRRTVRFWIQHRRSTVRDIATLLKVVVISLALDDHDAAARFGFAPAWSRAR